MTAIIDVDAHFEPGGDWLAPYPKLAAKLPKLEPALLAVDAIVGDLLRDVPEAQRPPVGELLPPGLLTLFGNEKLTEAERRKGFEGGEGPAEGFRAARRSRAKQRSDFEGKNQPLTKIMSELPDDMIVFSSDFPHFEGFTDPIGHYAQALDELSPARRERIYGASMAEVYERMGDPLL